MNLGRSGIRDCDGLTSETRRMSVVCSKLQQETHQCPSELRYRCSYRKRPLSARIEGESRNMFPAPSVSQLGGTGQDHVDHPPVLSDEYPDLLLLPEDRRGMTGM